MDSLIVERKLDSLQRCIGRVREKCPPDVATLADDADLQDIVVLNLSRAVQLCVDLALHLGSDLHGPPPENMGEAFTKLAEGGLIDSGLAQGMRNAVGFRNIAVHNYGAINWEITHTIATRHLDDFVSFARAVTARL